MASVGLAMKRRPGLSAHESAVGRRSVSKHICAKPRPLEQVAYIQNDVLDAVAAQRAVEEQDEERGGDAHPAHPFELLGNHLVRLDRALAGLTTDGQLAHHDDEAAGDAQENRYMMRNVKPPHWHPSYKGSPRCCPDRRQSRRQP